MDAYILEKLKHRIQELEDDIHAESEQITSLSYTEEDDLKFREPGYDDSGWRVLNSGQEWNGHDSVIWIRGTVKIPLYLRGRCLDLRVEAGPKETMEIKAEALLYLDGTESCAFDNWHSRMRLGTEWSNREEIPIALRVWSGMNETGQKRHFQGIWLEQVRETTEKYYYLSCWKQFRNWMQKITGELI